MKEDGIADTGTKLKPGNYNAQEVTDLARGEQSVG
jgi:hypothetical protein